MKRPIIPILLFIQLIASNIFAQSTKIDVNRVYNRNSLSFMIVSHPGDQFDDWTIGSFKQNDIGGKYNLNPLSNNVYVASFPRDDDKYTISSKAKLIESYLNKKKYAKEIISYWYNRQFDGSMDMTNVSARGRYNATEEDYNIAMMTKRKEIRLFDAGNDLISKSFIVVFDVHSINKKMYESTAKLAWEGVADAYLFQVDYDQEVEKQLYDCWFTAGDGLSEEDKQTKRNAFDQIDFKIKYVLSVSHYITQNLSGVMLNAFLDAFAQGNSGYIKPVYHGTGESEYRDFIFSMYQQSMDAIETQRPDFKVKTTIVSDWPVRAKIGKKEGLRRKQFYGLYEARLDETTNEVYAKEIATLMTTRIGRNQFNAYSNNMRSRRAMTKFAVLAKHGNIEPGMFIEAQPAMANLSLYHDVIVGSDIYKSSLIGLKYTNFMTTSSFSGSLLLDMWAAVNKVYDEEDGEEDASSNNFSAGMGLGYALGFNLFHPNVKFEAFAMGGFGYSTNNTSSSEEGSDEGSSSTDWNEYMFSVGGNLVFNINYPLQLYLKAEGVMLASSGELQPGFGVGIRYTPGARRAKKSYQPERVKMDNSFIASIPSMATQKQKNNSSITTKTEISNVSSGDSIKMEKPTNKIETNYGETLSKETPEQAENKTENIVKATILIGGVAIHPSQKSGYLMVGRVKRTGGYVKLKSNFNFSGKHNGSGDSDYLQNEYYLNGNEEKGNFALSGGMIWRLNSPLLLYSGLGYGSRWVNWTTQSGDQYRVTDISYKGIILEGGLLYGKKKFVFGVGVATNSFKYVETDFSIGYLF